MCPRCVPVSAAFLICLFLSFPPAKAAAPAEAFGQLPAIGDVRVSPDGKRAAMLQAVQGRMIATIYKVGAAAGTQPVVLNPGDGKLRSIEWANNERLLMWISATYQVPGGGSRPTFEWERVLSANADGSESRFLFRDDDFKSVINAPFLLSTLPNDPEHILMFQLDVDQYDTGGVRLGSKIPDNAFRGVSVYKVNVNTGREKKVESAWKSTRDWIVDSTATVRIRVDKNGKTIIHARGSKGGRFSEVARYDEDDSRSAMSFWGFGTDPNTVYVTARQNTDKAGVYAYDLTTGKVNSKIFLHDKYDVGAVLRDPYTDRIVGARYTDHMSRFVYWDPVYADTQKKLQDAFKGRSVSIVSMSRDRKKAAILVQPPGRPATYYFYEADARRVSPLGSRYPQLAEADSGTVKPISYKAGDGLTIPAYLTLPPGKEAKNLPLIVLPHGGPQERDDQSFHWWASFYASRGYAVLQPNFRGSSGYGANFTKAGFGEFGGKMQNDLSDGVKHLVAQGIADPERVCIVGASYGGYAALAGAAFTPELYACAVSVNGVSDLVYMMGAEVAQARQTGRDKDAFNVQYWEKWLGRRIGDRDKMAASSPARHAGQVRAPVLLIHGKDDTVVNFRQSEMMAKALEKAGKPHKLIELEGEDHWLSQAASRIRILKETEAFLQEHMGG